MTAAEIIRKKRDGEANTPEEIDFLVQGAVAGRVPDYQISAWLMAAFVRGLDGDETRALTRSFVESGVVMDYPGLDLPLVDKHSTGGVGDKTSLVVAPLAAACGCAVPMISGRGLGHTGGTLDKLESIPGLRTDLPLDDFRDAVARHGLALIGATDRLAPGDKHFYALRDVTATVESIPLIVASILSKKAAEGISALVLDVKAGAGAFMPDVAAARQLANELVSTGHLLGMKTVALITGMSQPLGNRVGNALEVEEALEVLRGEGPSDTRRLCIELAAWMVHCARPDHDLDAACRLAVEKLDAGGALEKFERLVEAQGGDPRIVDDPGRLVRARHRFEYTSPAAGRLVRARADQLGRAALLLGAGRRTAVDTVNHAVGLTLHKKVGDEVAYREPLVTVHYDDEARLGEARPLLGRAFQVEEGEAARPALIHEVIEQ